MTLPNPNPIPNTGNVAYNYTVDPSVPNGGSGNNTSNQVTTKVNNATIDNSAGGLTKAVDKTNAKFGDTLTYTIVLKNTGNTTADNVNFTDTIPSGTTFVSNSVVVNGVSNPGNPGSGINVGNIGPSSVTTIVFNVTVNNTLPVPNPIPNAGNVGFTYTVDPAVPDGVTGKGNSNIVNTQVNNAAMDTTTGGLSKAVDKTFANIGDTLTYTIVLKNTGNVSANNTVFKDTIPNGTSFVTGSVTLNGVANAGNPGTTGVTVGTIGPNQVSTIIFRVTITTTPNPNPIPNAGAVAFTYTADPLVPNGASGTGNSNIVNTTVSRASLGTTAKAVDKSFSNIGDTLTYTITIPNTGNVAAANVVVRDTIPSGTTFITNSVTVDGAASTDNPATGITVGTIPAGGITTITFKVIVGNTLPVPNPIPNSARINYAYTVDPSNPNGVTDSTNTNIVNTKVNNATIDNTTGGGLVKSVNKAFAQIGDTITYTIRVGNTGNVSADNVLFSDTIPNGTSFVANSLTINGTANTGNPGSGIVLPTIPGGGVVTITYNVIVTTFPNPNPIPNTGTITFNYTIDPAAPDGASGVGNTNTVNTQVNQAVIDNNSGIVKTVDKAFAKVGDTLSYTTVITNTGNTTANNAVFNDTIPNGTTFVTGSVTINGITNAGNPQTGLTLGSIGPSQPVTVIFKVVVNTVPTPNPIPNTSRVGFTYTIDPSVPNGASGATLSKQVTTQVNQATIDNGSGGLKKAVSKTNAQLGDTLTYTITVKNTGNATADNVNFIDTIPNGTTFVTNSVSINGVSDPGNPGSGVNLGNIGPNVVTTVVFQVTVNSTLPIPNPIPNAGRVAFTYTVDPAVPDGQVGTGNSNIVNTQVNNASIDTATGGLTKSVDKTFANIGDTLTYTIVLKNTGNVSANNTVFKDTIPNGTSFVTGSVTLNGVANAGNPGTTGVTVGTIGPNQVSTIIFRVTITTTPNPNPIPNAGAVAFTYTADPLVPNGASGTGNSNIVNTTVNSASLGSATKAVSKAFANIGDTLTYTITIPNTGNVAAANVVVRDTIPSGTTFVTNSVTVDGTGNTDNPATGINVGTIAAGSISTVTFQVVVNNTLPVPNPIPNSARLNYAYTVDPSNPNGVTGTTNTNIVNTKVNNATIDNTTGGGLTKAVNKTFAQIGDTLTYTIRVGNTGNTTADNVFFSDTIPNGTSFVPNSVAINGVANSGNPGSGVVLPTIPGGGVVTITYNVVVTTFPNPNPIPNTGTVTYNYTVDPASPDGISGSGNTNTVNTQVNEAVIDNNTGIIKTVDKAYAKVGDTLTYTTVITNTGNTTATNSVFNDTIPNGTTFVGGSVTINGTSNPGNPQTGLTLGNIGPNQPVTIIFSVVVNTIPTPNPIPNTSRIGYNYTIDPSVPNGASAATLSKQVTTQVNQAKIDNGSGGLTKFVNTANAQFGETLTYTIFVKNTGNATADNVNFTDTIPNGTTFVANSVTINGTSNPGNPQSGIGLGSIGPNAVTTIIFNVTVNNTLPTPNPIPNAGSVAYVYTVDPALPDGQSGTGNTNIVNTQVNNASMDTTTGGLIKAVDKTFANLGDTLTYTITLKNTGNVSANNTVFKDTIPNGTTFVAGSVTLNGVANAGNPGTTGVTVGTVGPNQVATIVFRVVITTVPNPNPIPNAGAVAFTYTANPSVPNGATGTGNSNIVNTTTNNATLGTSAKAVDKAYANLGDTLTYTITIPNTGNVTANNIILKDTIPTGTSFVAGSVTINGVANTGNPGAGINVGNVAPGAITTVQFQVIVGNTIPSTNPVPNSANNSYTYTVNPANPDAISGSNNTNIVNTKVNNATIDNKNGGGLVKTVSKAYAQIGDTLTYTIRLGNTGNVEATNVLLTDTIPNGTTFVPGSVRVNGVATGTNPGTGIAVPTIAAGGVATVTFNVVVMTFPNPNPIPNNGTVTYNYTVDPAVPNGGNGTGNTNTVNTQVNEAVIDNTSGLIKTVDLAYAKVGDTLTYTTAITNTGNVTANNVVFGDTIPGGTSFIGGSVTLNGTANPGNPQTGFTVGNIGPSQVVTVVFKVTITTIPAVNPIPNTSRATYNYTIDPSVPNGGSRAVVSKQVTTQVNQATIDNGSGGLIKAVDKAYADVLDTLTYTLTLKNTGNVTANNLNVTDTIPSGTSFVPGSVTVNGTASTDSPSTGINAGSLAPNTITTIIFRVIVNTIPTPNPIPNNATINFTYTADPNLPDGTAGKGNSNTVNTQVNNASMNNGSGGLSKSVDKAYAKVGDTLTYTLTLKNTGNVTANNVIVQDTIPSGTAYVVNSFIAKNTSFPGNPTTGINIGSIGPSQIVTATFKVIVTTIPSPNPIPNQGSVNFTYTVNPSIPNGSTGNGITNVVNTQVNQAYIDAAHGGLVKSVDRAYADVADTITYTLTLTNTGNTTANNVTLTDTVPNGTSFIPDSVTVNSIGVSGNPQTGINIGSLGPANSSVISFKVRVNVLTTPNPYPNSGTVNFAYTVDPSVPDGQTGSGNSNTVLTQVNTSSINTPDGFIKYVDKAYANLGDTLTYTLTIKNTGNVTANNVMITDTVPSGTTFVTGSIIANGIPVGGMPQTGINMGNISPNATGTITFKVVVGTTLPTPNPIPNAGKSTYTYTVDPAVPNGKNGGGNSNIVRTQINNAGLGNITKFVDKAYALCGDTLVYTIAVPNIGNVTATSVIITDTLPNNTVFVSGTVTINGIAVAGANPALGVNVGNIAPGSVTTLTYKVVINC